MNLIEMEICDLERDFMDILNAVRHEFTLFPKRRPLSLSFIKKRMEGLVKDIDEADLEKKVINEDKK